MKRHALLHIILILSLLSCTGRRPPVEIIKPSPTKTITLPDSGKKEPADSYIVNGERYYPLPDSHGFIQTGKASWYGEKFQGRPTASGEIYDMYKKSAAHKTLPLGTYVEVVNMENNRHTIIRINDRGPFVKGRIIDLSYAAAKEIALIGPGTCEVRISALGKEVGKENSGAGAKPLVEISEIEKGEFTIQIGSFKEKENAAKLADRLKVIFDYVNIAAFKNEASTTFYRLHVSKTETLTNAGKIEKKLEDMGFTEAFIVRL